MYIDILREAIQRNIEFVIESGLLDDKKIEKYAESNVHSVLHYCLIKINEIPVVPLPEYKIRLKNP